MAHARSDFREMLSAELVSVTGGVLAGVLLSFLTGEFTLLPGFLILLPGFLEMRGNISGSLSARLSSGLFVGALKPRGWHGRLVKGNVVASFFLVLIVAFVLSLVALAFGWAAFGFVETRIVWVALIAAVLSNAIEIPLTVAATFWLFRHGHDPNNVMGPYVTTTGDIISIVSLAVAFLVV